MSLRIVEWSTGNVGRHAIAGIDARPDLELAGVFVSNPDKVGKDAGTLAGLGRTLGVTATDDPDASAGALPRLHRPHGHGGQSAARGAGRPRAVPPRGRQRRVVGTGLPAVPRARGPDGRPLAGGRHGQRGVAVRQRDRSGLRQRRPPPGAERHLRADRRGPLPRGAQLRHLQPAHGALRHHGLRQAHGRGALPAPARGADAGVGERGPPAGRRPGRRARRHRGVVRAGARARGLRRRRRSRRPPARRRGCTSRCAACAATGRSSSSST